MVNRRFSVRMTFLILGMMSACSKSHDSPNGEGGSGIDTMDAESSSPGFSASADSGALSMDSGQESDRNPYFVEVIVHGGYPEAAEKLELKWTRLGQSSINTPDGGFQGLRLKQTFATAQAARNFEEEYELLVNDQITSTGTARFRACDQVTEAGIDPSEVVGAVFTSSVDQSVLSADTHNNDRGPLGCYLTAMAGTNTNRDIRRSIYRLRLDEGVARFQLDGQALLPASIQIWNDRQLYEVHFDSPSASLDTNPAALEVFVDDVSLGSIDASFALCERYLASDAIAEQELWLTVSGGKVRVDDAAGYTCYKFDGIAFFAQP
jgi:hypothetical protein